MIRMWVHQPGVTQEGGRRNFFFGPPLSSFGGACLLFFFAIRAWFGSLFASSIFVSFMFFSAYEIFARSIAEY